jgi:hypothetical protein
MNVPGDSYNRPLYVDWNLYTEDDEAFKKELASFMIVNVAGSRKIITGKHSKRCPLSGGRA